MLDARTVPHSWHKVGNLHKVGNNNNNNNNIGIGTIPVPVADCAEV